jgi:hypothetical protein
VLSAGVSSHIFTVRSNEELARTVPNSGCAHESFVTAASWACGPRRGEGLCNMNRVRKGRSHATHLPVCYGRPGAVRLVELPGFYAVIEGARCQSDTVKVIRGVSYEIGMRVL